eukprot:1876093-Pleurochrysis_carterae.AAC.1
MAAAADSGGEGEGEGEGECECVSGWSGRADGRECECASGWCACSTSAKPIDCVRLHARDIAPRRSISNAPRCIEKREARSHRRRSADTRMPASDASTQSTNAARCRCRRRFCARACNLSSRRRIGRWQSARCRSSSGSLRAAAAAHRRSCVR